MPKHKRSATPAAESKATPEHIAREDVDTPRDFESQADRLLADWLTQAHREPNPLRRYASALGMVAEGDELISRAWQAKYGVPYPGQNWFAWRELATRAGVPAEYLIGHTWNLTVVGPIVAGYLQRLADARASEPFRDPAAEASEAPALSEDASRVYWYLLELLPEEGRVGPRIAEDLGIDESKLRKRIFPALKPYGIEHFKRIGYRIKPSRRPD